MPVIINGTTGIELTEQATLKQTDLGTANGVTYLDGTKSLSSGSGLSFDGTTLNFGGTAQRITGDFSNATLANRTLFQTNAANTYTLIEAIPSGSGNLSIFTAYNSSDPANSSTMQLSCRSTEARIGTGIAGTGSYLPMTFYTSGSERMRIDSSGNLVLKAALQETKTAIAASAIDLSTGNYFTKTISGTTTFTTSNVPSTGTVGAFILELTNGGSSTVNWWSGVKWAGGTAPTLTSSGVDVIAFYTHDGGTTWRGAVVSADSK